MYLTEPESGGETVSVVDQQQQGAVPLLVPVLPLQCTPSGTPTPARPCSAVEQPLRAVFRHGTCAEHDCQTLMLISRGGCLQPMPPATQQCQQCPSCSFTHMHGLRGCSWLDPGCPCCAHQVFPHVPAPPEQTKAAGYSDCAMKVGSWLERSSAARSLSLEWVRQCLPADPWCK
jgi:hypothetical protein